MNAFEESKHPRDKDGKFTDSGGGNLGAGEAKCIFELAEKYGIEYNENTSYQALRARVEQAEKAKQKNISLSKSEWAQYYRIIGDEQHGDFVYKTNNGQRCVRLEDKIVLDDGSFENPKVQGVYRFNSNDDMNDWLNVLSERGVIK